MHIFDITFFTSMDSFSNVMNENVILKIKKCIKWVKYSAKICMYLALLRLLPFCDIA